MGFEEATPPVPERLAEIQMMDRLERSWLEQPYYRYYMQEDSRRAKMEYSRYNLTVRRKFLMNYLLFSTVTIPLAYLSRRFYTYNWFRTSGVPFTKKLTYFEKQTTPYSSRNKAANRGYVYIYLLSTLVLSAAFTDWNYRSDENYDKFTKAPKML